MLAKVGGSLSLFIALLLSTGKGIWEILQETGIALSRVPL